MPNPSKRKGDRGEREAAALIADLLGYTVKRELGAGRQEDTGDMHGLPDTVIQVADWADGWRAAREKPVQAESQRINDRALFAASFVRWRGGHWVVCMTPEQFATIWREATA
jgi:hypothetical protein